MDIRVKALLLSWLFEYGYEWVRREDLYGTEYISHINWYDLQKAGYLEYDQANNAERLTPKIRELLEEN